MSNTLRLLSKKQVKELVLYSYAHIDRLEAAGAFPKRVRMGHYNEEDWAGSSVRSCSGSGTWLTHALDARAGGQVPPWPLLRSTFILQG